ncbi:MAG: TIGR03619 family F420-dependent LLM class oxidoreductase [Acidimicrobiales bacterium]
MKIGIHLPQYGRASGPDGITRAAQAAEALGFEHVWVSDHVVHPAEQDYPSAHLFDPFTTLTWAAAATSRVGLGTSVVVAPHHAPLALANTLASLDRLSGGRVIAGIGVGWSQREIEALGFTFAQRGRRTDEIIDILRAAWTDDPVGYDGTFHSFSDVRVLPRPETPIPIWVGGSSEPAYQRACTRGDGFHAIGLDPDGAASVVERIRRDRPDTGFEISLRTGWDPLGMDPDQIRREYEGFSAAGIQTMVCAPWQATIDDWLESMERLAQLTALTPRTSG